MCAAGSIGLYWLLSDPTAPAVEDSLAYNTTTPNPERQAVVKAMEQPRIVSRMEWGARTVNQDAENETGLYSATNPEGWLTYDSLLHDAYQTVVVHHSALYEEDDLTTVRAVQDLHMDDRGWADVGYHYMVGRNGTIFAGRDLAVRGTHTSRHNTGSVGVCLLGNLEVDEPTQPQLAAAQILINWLAVRLQLTHLAGHGDFNAETVCPGATIRPKLEAMATAAGLAYGTDGYSLPSNIVPSEDNTPTPTVTTWQCPSCAA